MHAWIKYPHQIIQLILRLCKTPFRITRMMIFKHKTNVYTHPELPKSDASNPMPFRNHTSERERERAIQNQDVTGTRPGNWSQLGLCKNPR